MNKNRNKTNLALTPPMGWNSWNTFGPDVTEADVRATSDYFVDSGLRDLGYRYIVIDDFWEADERVDGRLTWNTRTFPNGIPALADYLHERDLKFGIYSCSGTHTCGGKPGSFRYEETDARTFAEWGVDYLKYDGCFHPPEVDMKQSYRRMGQALRNSGRDIIYSLCNWGLQDVWTWGRLVGGHLWRTTGDIQDNWKSIYNIGFRRQKDYASFAGPGGWNDPDMLVVGMRGKGNKEVIVHSEDAGCTDDEYRSHFALWCLLSAPLMIGCDVCSMDENAREILTNRELIAINQDSLGIQATCIGAHRNVEVWVKPLADGSIAAGLFNLGPDAQRQTPFAWESIGLPETESCRVKELYTDEERGVFTRFYTGGAIPSHGCEVIRIEPVS